MSAHSRYLADEAARRGWRYSPTGDDLGLPGRWRWSLHFAHPFQYHGHGRGMDRRTQARDVLSGATPAGHPFWAFWFSMTAGRQHGSFVTRSVAFIYTGLPLPTVSVLRRDSLGTRPIMSELTDRAARRARQRQGSDAEVQALARRFGWAVGSAEFQRQYLVKADNRLAAEWLAGPVTQQRLLAAHPAISLVSHSADILAWSDYGGSHIARVEDFDVAMVDAMLDVLDTIDLTTWQP